MGQALLKTRVGSSFFPILPHGSDDREYKVPCMESCGIDYFTKVIEGKQGCIIVLLLMRKIIRVLN